MKKALLSLLARSFALFLALGGGALRAAAEPYALWVGGETQVTSDNADDVFSNTTVRFEGDATGGTLFFKDADLRAYTPPPPGVLFTNILAETGFELAIALEGNNFVRADGQGGHGIYADGGLSLRGGGTLEVGPVREKAIGTGGAFVVEDGAVVTAQGGSFGIGAVADIVLSNATVTAAGSNSGLYTTGGVMRILGRSTVSASGAQALYAEGGIEIGEGLAVVLPVGGGLSADGTTIVDAAGNAAERVLIAVPGTLLGSGTEEDPYVVYDYATLVEFAQVVNGGHPTIPQNQAAWAVVTNDITTTETDWTAIGADNYYQGTFDGAGHAISGLAYEGNSHAGLFGVVGSGGVVRNVRLAEVSFHGKGAGGIAEANQGTVSNCCVSGSVQGEKYYYAGGVVGLNYGTVANCYNTGEVSVGEQAFVGGVVGYNNGTVSNCHGTGAVSGGETANVGGVVGYNDGTVANCFCLESLGVGAVENNDGGTVEGCGELSATDYTNAARFSGWDFDHVWVMWKAGPVLRMEGLLGSGTAEDPYGMYDYATLVAFAEAVNGGQTNAWGVIAADIATTETDWTPIGPDGYTGTFDGAGHTISGLANAGTPLEVGLFGVVDSGGVVRNVRLAGVAFNGEWAGGVAGYNEGTVSNCCVSGSVRGRFNAGGVVGDNCGTVSNCYNTGTVSGGETAAVGGVVGRNYIGTVANCHSTGVVSGGEGAEVGGVVGSNAGGTVSNSYCPFSLRVAAIGAGHNTGTVEECWPLSAAEYTQTNSFRGWDFANVWEMGPEAPVLRGVSRVYPLWVDGVQVWDGNEADILGNGTARYAGTKTWGTLMLSGADITNAVKYQSGRVYTAGIYAGDGFDLTISLDGSNRVENASWEYGEGIRTRGNLSFGGAGSLTAKGGAKAAGIYTGGNLRIEEATVAASGGTGLNITGNTVLTNATVSATGSGEGIHADGTATFAGESRVEVTGSGGNAVYANDGITVGAELTLVEPDGGGVEENGHYFVDAGGYAVQHVLLESVEAYNLWVDGVQVCSTNAGDILGDGKARFEGTAAGGMLALSNAVVTNAVAYNNLSSAGIYAGDGFDLMISLDGSNQVANAREHGYGILANGNLSLGGAGSLTAEAGRNAEGISAKGNLRIEGTTVAASGVNGVSSGRNIVLTNATVTATGVLDGIYAIGAIAFAEESRVEATATESDGEAIYANDGITLGDRIGVALPVGGGVSGNGTTITNAAGNTATNAIVAYFYDITVVGGSTTNSPSAAGFPVEIVADEPQDGEAFVQWSSNVEGLAFEDAGASPTWFPMPATNVTVTAVSAEIVITWEGETEYTYTGSAITPDFTVSLTNVDLHVGTNYVASWAGNTNAGTATVSVTLTNRPSGVQTNTFRIKPKPLEDEMVQLTVPDAGWWTYTGEALQPGFSLSDGNPSALTTNDVVLSWNNNVGPGIATAVFAGTNNYTGRVVKEFEIRWASETVDGTAWSYRSDLGGGTSATVTGADSAEGELAVPETLGGLPVAGIGDGAFAGAANLTSVTIPDGVADIGEEAFAGCTALTNVWIGTGIESVGTNAFAGCDALAEVWVPVEKAGTGLLGAAALPGTCEIHYYGTQVVTFEPEGGSCAVQTNGYAIGAAYGALPEASRAGYAFEGWWDAADGGTQITAESFVPEEATRTLHAHWRAVFSVRFDAAGGRVSPATKVVDRNAPIGQLPVPVRADYTFLGWYTTATGGTLFAEGRAVPRDLTLYARWTKTVKTVRFNPYGGTVSVTSKQVRYDPATGTQPIGKMPTPRRSGQYVWLGWYTTATGGTVFTEDRNVPRDLTLYARWKPAWKLVFDANGGSCATGSLLVQKSRCPAKLPTATRSGYALTGWYTAKSGGTKVTTATAIRKNMRLYARWAAAWTVKFDANGGTCAVKSRAVRKGAAVGTLPTPTRDGWKFLGWYTAKSGGSRVAATSKINANRTFYARWEKKAAAKATKSAPAVRATAPAAAKPVCIAVTASGGGDASAVADGDETTSWTPGTADGSWVVLTLASPCTVEDVVVTGDNLPAGTRFLLSEDADGWQEGVPGKALYVWVVFPASAAAPVVKEIRLAP